MTIAPVSLFSGAVPNTPSVLYTAPAKTTVTLTRTVVTNISAGGVALTVWVVRSGGSPVNGNIIFGASAAGQSIAAGPSTPTVIDAMSGLVLDPGDSIQAQAASASTLNLVGSGWLQST